VIGAEKLTTITDWTERNTCVLFGDGRAPPFCRDGGARPHQHISRATVNLLISFGCPVHRDPIRGTMSTSPADHQNVGQGSHKQASAMVDAAALEKAGLTIDDIACAAPPGQCPHMEGSIV
jgi:3-oxoacyl-[acyl-carrier-protein] synthase III